MKKTFSLILASLLILGGLCMPNVTYAAEKSLTIDTLDEVVWPCIDVVKSYLQAGADEDVNNYEFHVPFQGEPVTISWKSENLGLIGYSVELATKSDFSDAKTVIVDYKTISYSFKYLLRDTKYYVRVSALGPDGYTAQTEFTTTYDCPRFLDVGGVYNNCRDLGGYKVGNKQMLQNMIIRGSSPDNCRDADSLMLTQEGYDFLNNVVGIKTQLDLRGSTENCGRTTSTFESAPNYVHVPLSAYSACYTAAQAELYRQAFSVFAYPENYPVYFHCAGGADRTGTVAIILLAYLGVSRDEIIQDYVVTTFSPVCYSQNARSKETAISVLGGLDGYAGETLSEKAKSYLVSIGVTQQELFNIKAIMFGESLDGYVPEKDYGIRVETNFYSTTSNEDFAITLNEANTVSKVLVDDATVTFTQSDCTITLSADSLKNLAEGSHKGEVVFADGNKAEFTLNVNFQDLTGDLQVSSTSISGDYTRIDIIANGPVFDGINYHFRTRRSTLYPHVEPHILINGVSVAELNDNTDMSSYTWNTAPGSTDTRHQVPVSSYSTGNTMTLLCHTSWLENYLDGKEMIITLEKGFSYTYGGLTYKILTDIVYQYTGGNWIKVTAEQNPLLETTEFVYNTASGGALSITLTKSDSVNKVLIDNNSVSFEQAGSTLSIPASVLSTLSEGTHKGVIVMADGEKAAFTLNINFFDLAEALQVTSTSSAGDYDRIHITASTTIFGSIGYHFHTRRTTIYPDVQPHILINGTSIASLNDNTDMSSYTWNTEPGSTDTRHHVPVSVLALDDTMTLLCRADWLESYLNGNELTLTLEKGLTYTYNGIKYYLTKDISYRYTNGKWEPTVAESLELVSDKLTFYTSSADALEILFTGNGTVQSLTVDENSVPFTQNGNVISVSNDTMKELANGNHTARLTFGNSTTLDFSINIVVDLTEILSYGGIETQGDYIYFYINADSPIFADIGYHFVTRRSTLYPGVLPNIKVNGQSVSYLNDTTDMSSYTWSTAPANTDNRHRVPVSVLANQSAARLLIKSRWLMDYLVDDIYTVTLCKGLSFTYNGVTYELLQDKKFSANSGFSSVLVDAINSATADTIADAVAGYRTKAKITDAYNSLPAYDVEAINNIIISGAPYADFTAVATAYDSALKKVVTGADGKSYNLAWQEDFSNGLDENLWTVTGTLRNGAVGADAVPYIDIPRKNLDINGEQASIILTGGVLVTGGTNYITRNVENPESVVTVYFYDEDNSNPQRFNISINDTCAITSTNKTTDSPYYTYLLDGETTDTTVKVSKGWHKVVFDGAAKKGVVTAYLDNVKVWESTSQIEYLKVGNIWTDGGHNVYWVDQISVATKIPTITPGDADFDGKVTVYDAVAVLKSVAGITTASEYVVSAADVDGDGTLTVLDATRILRYVARITDKL